MIYQYEKVTDQYTTYTMVLPLNDDGGFVGTELATVGGTTYVHVPDNTVLPDQPEQIMVESVTLTDELKAEIKALSPHVKLSYSRLQERIRGKYSIEDEQYFTRISVGALTGTYEMQTDEPALIAEYQAWVEESREIARLERVALGLG